MNPFELSNANSSDRFFIQTNYSITIISSSFIGIITSCFQGGGLHIYGADKVLIDSSFFKRCSATNYGGAFYVDCSSFLYRKSCSFECYHTVELSWNLGGGGYVNASASAVHTMSNVVECAPADKRDLNAHGCFGIKSKHIESSFVNASNGSKCGYLVGGHEDGSFVKYITVDNMILSGLYPNHGGTMAVSFANLVGLRKEEGQGALQCRAATAIVDHTVFMNNLQDINADTGGTVVVMNSITDRDFLWSSMTNCSVGQADFSTHEISFVNACGIPKQRDACFGQSVPMKKESTFILSIYFIKLLLF